MTKQALQTDPEVESSKPLGDDKHEIAGRNGQNFGNGIRTTTGTTDIGPVELEVPRDREGSFESKTVQLRLHRADERVLSLAPPRA